MTIYFNKHKDAYGYEIPDYIATIDEETWDKYCSSKLGLDYDIIEGVFTPLRDEISIKRDSEALIKENERLRKYIEADNQISKCNNYIELNIETDKYIAIKHQWLLYKMAVRETQNQENYPFEITYPSEPNVVE